MPPNFPPDFGGKGNAELRPIRRPPGRVAPGEAAPRYIRAMHAVLIALQRAMIVVVAVILGIGVPLFWVWVGSRLQGGTLPSLSALAVVIVGVGASYWLIMLAFGWIKARTEEASPYNLRSVWNRSMRDARHEVSRETHPVETILVLTTILVAVVGAVWFFVFGDPGIRPGT